MCPFPIDGSEPPQMFGNIPPTHPVECVVRVYVVRVSEMCGCSELSVGGEGDHHDWSLMMREVVIGSEGVMGECRCDTAVSCTSLQALDLQPKDPNGKVRT